MGLTPDQVRLFRHNGFLKLKNRLPAERVERLKAAIWKDIQEEAQPVVKDAEGRVGRISKILDRDPVFRETATDPLVLEPLTGLLGPAIEIVRNRHNHATLNRATKRLDRFHRDVLQWTRGIVTVIFYLEEATPMKGCTMVIPGSHLLPQIGYTPPVDHQAWVEKMEIEAQAVPVPMPVGGMLAIDSLILHRIGTNQTDLTRMSMTVGYHSADELAGTEDPKRVLVRGERRYRGNDR